MAVLLPTTLNVVGDANPSVQLPPKENFHLYLLAGQSNMAGRGVIDPEDNTAHPRVFMLSKNGTWIPAIHPIHYDKPVAGAGLALAFAKEIADRNQQISIGLIPAACGGSPISIWEPGAYFDATDSHPYNDAITRTKQAMESGALKGVLWHQGESDSKPQLAENYKGNLVLLIERFRKDFKAPTLPFIIGQLGRFPDAPWSDERERVDQSHREISREVPKVAFVSSEGLSSKGDNLHFNSESLRVFGKKYAKETLKIMKATSRGLHR